MSVYAFVIPASSTIQVEGGGNAIVLQAFSATPGASAYDIAVKNGFAGKEPEWLASLSVPDASFDVDLVTIYNLFK